MKRREFITLAGGAVAGWPLVARAQQPERLRHVGVLMSTGEDDPETQLRLDAFVQGLRQAGWSVGHNVRVDTRWASGETARLRALIAEMLSLSLARRHSGRRPRGHSGAGGPAGG
jgi:putative tryptophan/tyrosine transport system substrate-binding protein